jgi:BNR repeat-like domain
VIGPPPHPAPAPPPLAILPAPAGVNHGAGLLSLGEALLLACWYSGRSEAGPDARILCSRSPDGGVRWDAPQAASTPHETALGAPAPGKSVGNVVLTRDTRGRIVMIAGEVQSRRIAGVETCKSWRCGRIDFRISTDLGRSWSPPTRLDDRPGALPRSRPTSFAAHDFLPVYQERGSASVLSLDLAALEPGRAPRVAIEPIPAGAPVIQPTLAPAQPGEPLRAYLRDPHRRFVYAAVYDAAAQAWSRAVPTNLPNPGSAVEAFRDGAGRVALIHNRGHRDRKTLSLAFSTDGDGFAEGCDLTVEGAHGEVAYPAAASLGDGAWGVAFSIDSKRRIAFVRLDRAWLEACANAAGLG